MNEMRKIADLAAEIGVCERQFHRRLDAREPKAMMALRQELLWHAHNSFVQLNWRLDEAAKDLRRCNPDIAADCEALLTKISVLLDTPSSLWQVKEQQRLLDEAGDTDDE